MLISWQKVFKKKNANKFPLVLHFFFFREFQFQLFLFRSAKCIFKIYNRTNANSFI